jgi:polysaccharide export outer membrane protein
LARVSAAAFLALAFTCGRVAAQEVPAGSPGAGPGDYRIQIGDVLEVAAAGVPDLRLRVPVGLDGEIAYPLVGHIKVAGLPLQEVRDMLRQILPTKIYQLRTTDGRELSIHILEEEVTVAVAEYRPVYLNGDVAKPGEIMFRPGLTVRQAIALAGGFDIMRFRMSNPFLEAADLRADYESLWLDYAKDKAKADRLQAELSGQPQPPAPPKGAELPVPPDVATKIAAVEAQQFKLRTGDLQQEKAYLENSLRQTRDQLASLEDRAGKEGEGAAADQKETERIRDLFQKGTVPITRLTDARRFSLMSATQWLQTTVQATQIRRQAGDIARQIQKTDDQRRMDALNDLQDVQVRLAATRARLAAVGEKLLYTGAIKSQLVRGQSGPPSIEIHRRKDGRQERVSADEDTVLQPGDVVDVALVVQTDLAGPLPVNRP